jgi:hypothetical protein
MTKLTLEIKYPDSTSKVEITEDAWDLTLDDFEKMFKNILRAAGIEVVEVIIE